MYVMWGEGMYVMRGEGMYVMRGEGMHVMRGEGMYVMRGEGIYVMLLQVEQYVVDAVKRGGKVVVGGRRSALGGTFEPSLITGVTADMMMSQQEIFGPVAGIIK